MPPRSMMSEKQSRNDVLAEAHLRHRNDVLSASDLLQRNDVRSVAPERCPGGPQLAWTRWQRCLTSLMSAFYSRQSDLALPEEFPDRQR